jgi:hypothetical protein
MVGQGFEEIIAEVPSAAQRVGRHFHEPALASKIFEEHHELELEEDHRVYRWAATASVQGSDHLPHEGEVQRPLQVPVEVVGRDQILQ